MTTKEGPPCSNHIDAPHGFNRNASHSVGRYVCDCEGWTPEPMTSDSWINSHSIKQLPDCRACANFFDSDAGYNCAIYLSCIQGDQYQPAPKVVLWRTE